MTICRCSLGAHVGGWGTATSAKARWIQWSVRPVGGISSPQRCQVRLWPLWCWNVQVHPCHEHRYTFHSLVNSLTQQLLVMHLQYALQSLGAGGATVNKPPHLNKMPGVSAMRKTKLSGMVEWLESGSCFWWCGQENPLWDADIWAKSRIRWSQR